MSAGGLRAPLGWRQRNWEGCIVSYPQVPASPKSVQDLIEIMTNGQRYPSPVRAAGSNHSTTACATANGGTLVDMRGMAEILEFGADFVTVQGGATYMKIARALREKNLQFYINTEIGNLTAGSAACCGTKDGAFLPDELGQICSYVTAMKLVTPAGSRLEANEQDHPDLMRVLRSSYGLLGIVYEVTFRVTPLRKLSVRHESYHTERFLRRLPALMRDHQSLVLYIFPHIDTVSAELRDYRDEGRPRRPWVWELRNFFWRTGAPAVAQVITRFVPIRALRFWLLDGLSWLIQYGVMLLFRADHTDPSKQIIWYAPEGNFPSYTFSMWAFPIERYPGVLRAYMRFCRDYCRDHSYQVNLLTVGYRVAADTSSLLSYSREGTILSLDPVSTGDLGWHEFLRAFNEFASAQDGIPLFNQTDGVTPAQARRAFGARLDELEARRQQFDPGERLLNPYFRALLQSPPGPPPAVAPRPVAPSRRARGLKNFGRTVRFRAERLTPASESDVLSALAAHRGRRIRAVGALHSWSPVARGEEVVMDLRRLATVTVNGRGTPGVTVTAGGGCRIATLLKALAAQGLTLPTVGAITKQTIAGAISTGTHGSGASSLSHYVRAVRIATYDPATRTPVALDIAANTADPDPLRAARCSVGSLGIIVTVTLACVPAYDVEESPVMVASVHAAVAEGDRYPLQFITIVPYAWRAYVLRRRQVERTGKRSRLAQLGAWAYRQHAFWMVDVALHGMAKALGKLAWGDLTRAFYRWVVPAIAMRGVTVTDTSDRRLTLRHDLYRHVEMEVFVPADALAGALEIVRHLTDAFAGVRALPPDVEALLATRAPGALVDLSRNRGRYTHHYIIPCRRVLPDDTLISMTADGREAYALGFFTYRGLEPGYATYCRAVALALIALYGARLHWGKYFPVTYDEAVRDAYPGLARFRELCDRYDSQGVFRNPWTRATLGMG
jgi:FAD/FMN-containing dehydrogenase